MANLPKTMVSRHEAVQQAKRATRRFRLRLTSIEAQLVYYRPYELFGASAQHGPDSCAFLPAWRLDMLGLFKWHGCVEEWRVVVGARNGVLYESGTGGHNVGGCRRAA